jgi:EAL domain-containing protein (putative c-di-GMP-specific phosphodiesterase class I)
LEVLVRWQRPTGIVAPLDFIPLAERNGAIVEIGEEVLRQACLQFGGWHDAGDVRSIAVNVSAVQVQDEHFATRILAILAAGDVRPAQVVVEVTESVFLAPGNRVIEQLSMLRTPRSWSAWAVIRSRATSSPVRTLCVTCRKRKSAPPR